MRFGDFMGLAGASLLRNKLRTILTTTGVTVGVFALTTIIALGGGLETAVIAELTDDESETRIIVRPGFGPRDRSKPKVEGVDDPAKADRLRKSIAKRRRGGPAQMRRTLLTVDALEAIAAREHVTSVRPLAIDRFAIGFGEHQLDGALSYGVIPGDEHWNRRVLEGGPFADERGVWLHEYLLYTWGYTSDAAQGALVGELVTLSRPREDLGISSMLAAARANGIDVPVDSRTAEQFLRMFGGGLGLSPGEGSGGAFSVELPIRGVIRERIEEDRFEVWEDSFSMQADVFLPQGLAEELFVQTPSNVTRGYNAASLEVDDPAHVAEVEKALKREGYGTVSVGSILDRVGKAMAIITTVVSGLTAIALLVALLGIVNTMVMNVSERTREIGILKALGASDRQVLGLFLVESGLIGLLGGVLGVGFALLASIPGDAYTQDKILQATQYRYDGTIFSFPPWLVGLAMAFALILSVLAALGPARRASRVDPVTALRDE